MGTGTESLIRQNDFLYITAAFCLCEQPEIKGIQFLSCIIQI